MANGKLQLFVNLNKSKQHCYTLSTTCTLFKLASEVGPRTNISVSHSSHQAFSQDLAGFDFYFSFDKRVHTSLK